MAGSGPISATVSAQVYAKKLADDSDLFAIGPLTDQLPDEQFIRRLNALIYSRRDIHRITLRHLSRQRSRNRAVTKHDLKKAWRHLFQEEKNVSDFNAPLRSMKRVLSKYLEYLHAIWRDGTEFIWTNEPSTRQTPTEICTIPVLWLRSETLAAEEHAWSRPDDQTVMATAGENERHCQKVAVNGISVEFPNPISISVS